jgi:RNA methyltransferase, TrmH family
MRLLTLARDLRRRRARERQGCFVVEGIRANEELLRSRLDVLGFLLAPQLDGTDRGRQLRAAIQRTPAERAEVSEREFASAAETDSPQGILALVRVPERSLGDLTAHASLRVVVLDAVQDPGNAGAIIRTAAALGATATLALPGTVDVWNAKVVRSAMGAHFHHLSFSTTWNELRTFLTDAGCELWGSAPDGEPVPLSAPVPRKLALAVGNEGSGLTPTLREAVQRTVSIRLTADVESLNVAVATGILLYALSSHT